MQVILGLICIAAGASGIVAYIYRGTVMSSDDKITMLLGFFMALIGVIIIYAGGKNKTDND